MRNNPLLSIVQPPQFGTRQKEETPIDIPFSFLALTVGLLQDWCQLAILPVGIQIVQPPVGGFLIVHAAHSPMVLHGKVLGKVQEQIITGHGAPGEKVVGHPPLFKVIAKVAVRENVHKQLAPRSEKGVNLLEQVMVILHVFKHFDRHDEVIVLDDSQGALVVRDVALLREQESERNMWVCANLPSHDRPTKVINIECSPSRH